MDGRRTMALGMIVALAAGGTMAGAAHAQEGGPIPTWIKSIFAFYLDGQITDDELISALEFLIAQDIIQVAAEAEQDTAAEVERAAAAERTRAAEAERERVAYAAAADAYNDAIKTQRAATGATIDAAKAGAAANGAYAEANMAILTAAESIDAALDRAIEAAEDAMDERPGTRATGRAIEAANDLVEIRDEIGEAMEAGQRGYSTYQSAADRAIRAGEDAGRAITRAHSHTDAAEDAFNAGNPDVAHIKRAADAFTDAADMYADNSRAWAALADERINVIKKAANKWAALDSAADPYIWPPRVVDKLADAAHAWERAYDAHREAAEKQDGAAAEWAALAGRL